MDSQTSQALLQPKKGFRKIIEGMCVIHEESKNETDGSKKLETNSQKPSVIQGEGSSQGCQGITEYLNRFVLNTMDELPSRSQPVNPSHVTLNGLSHYYTHNASVDNSL